MTTFHDPPPQSRRAARQSEREQNSDGQPTVEGFTTFPAQAHDGQSSAAENNTSSAFEAPAANSPVAQRTPAVATGANADEATSPPAAASETPRERTMTRRELREMRAREEAANRAAEGSDAAVNDVPPTQPPHAAAAPAAPVQAPPVVPVARPLAEDRPLASPSTPPPAVAPTTPPSSAEPPHPSLADLAAAASAAAAETSQPAKSVEELSFAPSAEVYVEPPALVDPLAIVPEAASDAASDDALSAFESLLGNTDGSAQATPAAEAPRSPLADLPAPSSSAPAYAANVPAPGATQEPSQPQPPLGEGLLGFTPDAATDTAPDESHQTTLDDARAEFDQLARKRLDGAVTFAGAEASVETESDSVSLSSQAATTPQPETQTAAPSVPSGHWSAQSGDEDGSHDAVVARTVSSGSTATNALVLPAIPFATDIRGPLTSSGETMLTGSIDLPSTLSASGVSERFDKGDIDSLLDLNDSDMVSTDSAPVRAVKAVSTFSNQSVTQTQKPKGTRALTVLLISAASMAVVVAGLLVAAFAFNML